MRLILYFFILHINNVYCIINLYVTIKLLIQLSFSKQILIQLETISSARLNFVIQLKTNLLSKTQNSLINIIKHEVNIKHVASGIGQSNKARRETRLKIGRIVSGKNRIGPKLADSRPELRKGRIGRI